MSFLELSEDSIEFFSIKTNPKRTYVSSSTGEITGSIVLNLSEISSSQENINKFIDTKRVNEIIDDAILAVQNNNINIFDNLQNYLVFSHIESIQEIPQIEIPIEKFGGTNDSGSISYLKNYIKKLNTQYKEIHSGYDLSYNDFHCINFISSSTFSNDHSIIYPNYSSIYSLSNDDGFTFDFYIKITEKTKNPLPQTLLHLSSSYAITILSGSEKDENDNYKSYKILLQLANGTDIDPKDVNVSSDLCYISEDKLYVNEWNHVVIRWGTNKINAGTGSFYINDIKSGEFVINSGSFPNIIEKGEDISCLFLGNYYSGDNNGSNRLKRFFSNDVSISDGLIELDSSTGITQPDNFIFSNYANFELQDLKIYKKYLNNLDIKQISNNLTASYEDNLIFKLDLIFEKNTPLLNNKIITSPQVNKNIISGFITKPINNVFAGNTNEYIININSFLCDKKNNKFPRILNLSGSFYGFSGSELDNSYNLVHENKNLLLNNYIKPSDNSLSNLFRSNLSLENIISSGELLEIPFLEEYPNNTEKNIEEIIGSNIGSNILNPNLIYFVESQDPNKEKYDILNSNLFSSFLDDEKIKLLFDSLPTKQVYSLRDKDSLLLKIFKISPIYFSKRIEPKTFIMVDNNFDNFGIKHTIKDNGFGGLYRADSENPNEAGDIGNIYYDHGLVVIKNPCFYHFGNHGFEMSFNGHKNIYVNKISANAPAGFFNRSSNDSGNTEKEFCMISGINFYDENFNVVLKSKLAQPIMKRFSDKINFRVKIDY